jgi:hypothetical protein
MVRHSKKNNQKKHQAKSELSGEALMADALQRIAKINIKSGNSISGNTFDKQISQNNVSQIRLITDIPQKEEKTPSSIPTLNDGEDIVSSQKDYVDLKIGKEILNFEKKLIKEISEGKSSIQKWGIGLIIGALIGAAGIMVAMQLFSAQQLKEYISDNFSNKFEISINDTNINVMRLEKEQKTIKQTLEGMTKNSKGTKKNKLKPQPLHSPDGKKRGGADAAN